VWRFTLDAGEEMEEKEHIKWEVYGWIWGECANEKE
jgi:hypothetical protein